MSDVRLDQPNAMIIWCSHIAVTLSCPNVDRRPFFYSGRRWDRAGESSALCEMHQQLQQQHIKAAAVEHQPRQWRSMWSTFGLFSCSALFPPWLLNFWQGMTVSLDAICCRVWRSSACAVQSVMWWRLRLSQTGAIAWAQATGRVPLGILLARKYSRSASRDTPLLCNLRIPDVPNYRQSIASSDHWHPCKHTFWYSILSNTQCKRLVLTHLLGVRCWPSFTCTKAWMQSSRSQSHWPETFQFDQHFVQVMGGHAGICRFAICIFWCVHYTTLCVNIRCDHSFSSPRYSCMKWLPAGATRKLLHDNGKFDTVGCLQQATMDKQLGRATSWVKMSDQHG